MHQLSPVKRSNTSNIPYFDLKVQTENDVVRAVCFSPDKHDNFKRHFEASSAVKLSHFQLKNNKRTCEDEIHINKRTKLEDPSDSEVSFDISEDEPDHGENVISVADAKSSKAGTAISAVGRVTFQGGIEYVNARGKKLKKQETILTDESSSIRLVLWESDIDNVQSGCTYMLTRLIVRVFDGQPYISVNKDTKISKVSTNIANDDDKMANSYKESTIETPPEGVLAIQRSLSCKKCTSAIVGNSANKLIKCSACGLTQLSHLCKKTLQTNAFFVKQNGEKVSLLIKHDLIEELLHIHHIRGKIPSLQTITDDELMTILLTVKAVITYNNRNVATAVNKC